MIRREQPVESIRKEASGWLVKSRFGEEGFDQIVLALPSFESARLLQSLVPENQIRFLRDIHYQPIMLWNWLAERLSSFPRGFGCLVPRTEGSPVLGSLWRSEIFEGAVRGQLVTLSQFFAGENLPQDPRTYEQQIRNWIPGIGKTVSSEFRVYTKGIPQLRLGHSGQMDEVLRLLPKGVSLIGNYIDGVGLVAVMSRIESALAPLLDHFPRNN
jgi:protoporphyrinogen oxidase